MNYRHVGKTGLRVSEISLGGWITLGGTIDREHSDRIIDAALGAGINFIDLADVYANGRAEEVAGRAIAGRRRGDVVISSKVFWPMSKNPNDRGLSRKHIIESCEASLKRLGTDYLDLYFCHRWDEKTPLEETVRAMEDLIRQGKVLYWGTSVWTAEQIAAACSTAERFNAYAPVVEQPRYNLFDRHIEDDGVLAACRERGIGLVVWSPLAQGMLAGKYDQGVPEGSRASETKWLDGHLTDDNIRRSQQFSALAREAGHEPGQVALAWLLRRPEISSVITGASRTGQLESNLAAMEIQLDEELVKRIEAIFAGAELRDARRS